jgi:hypothetical protein
MDQMITIKVNNTFLYNMGNGDNGELCGLYGLLRIVRVLRRRKTGLDM